MQYFAWFGTGECDPNKDLKQFLAFMAFVVGWFVAIRLLRKVESTNKSQATKVVSEILIVSLAIIGSILLFLATWLGLACGR